MIFIERIGFPVLFVLPSKIEIIHPFIDGNGRTGRLLVNSGEKNNSRGNPFSWIPAGDLSA